METVVGGDQRGRAFDAKRLPQENLILTKEQDVAYERRGFETDGKRPARVRQVGDRHDIQLHT